MVTVKSLDDLYRLRQAALKERQTSRSSGKVQIFVSLGTCGIAVGAQETLNAILHEIESENNQHIQVIQTGCIGLCGVEPVVQVQIDSGSRVTYGKVTPKIAKRILDEHVHGGETIKEYVVENGSLLL